MRFTTRRAAAAVAALTLVLTACGDDGGTTDDTGAEPTNGGADADGEAAADLELINEGTLSVCSDIPYPPFEFEDADAPSGYSGFDIDLMQETADRLGLELEVLEVGFDGLQSGATLAAGQCDIAASAMTITEERQQNLNFSEPYYDSLQSLIVLADSDVQSLEDVAGQALGVQQGTTGAEYAQENAPEGTEIVEFGSGPDLFTAMQAGQIVAGLQDLPVNVEQVNNDPSFEIVEEYDTGEQYGFAAAQGNDSLIEAVNEQLAAMRDDGTYDEIYDRYFAVEE
ncbi:basic amino acid ABC transporter substrate-binding protein [Egicoccus sp. AB-alg2]|uniref:basic amino acid ABC transporter substrate-binding protein n=1 Tax=Egicoccus sp. AB-alg2 TaxID=3242693 RepID=UPI00359D40EB